MPRAYTVTADNITITNAGGDTDLVELDPATDKPIELFGIRIFVTSEVQEAQEEWLRCKIIRGHTTSGSTPEATPTPRPVSPNDTAAAFTAEIDNTTIASAGTAVDLDAFAINVRAGYEIMLPAGAGYWVADGSLLVVRLMTTVADDLSMSMTYHVNEYP